MSTHVFKLLFQKFQLDFVIDLHANANLKGLYIMGNSYDSVYRYERHVVFPKMMAQNCKDFSKENTIYNADEEKEGTARRYIMAYTINVRLTL